MSVGDKIKAAMNRLRFDLWENTFTGINTLQDRRTHSDYEPRRPKEPWVYEAMWQGDVMAGAYVEKVVDLALSEGIDWSEDFATVADEWDVIGLLSELGKNARGIGAAAIFMATDNPMEPFVAGPDKIRWIRVVPRTDLSIISRYRETESDFGQPEFYDLNNPRGVPLRVHESNLIVLEGTDTTRRFRDMNSGWALSVLYRVYPELRDVSNMLDAVGLAFGDLSQAVFKIKGLMDMIARGHENEMLARMQLVSMGRGVARAVVVDEDGEDFSHVGAANLTGVAPILQLALQRLAAAFNMPLTVLMGMSPAGLNATGESDTRSWYKQGDSYRRDRLDPVLERLVPALAANAGMSEDEEWEWPSLWAETEDEREEAETKKVNRLTLLIDKGVLTENEVRQHLFAGRPLEELVEENGDIEKPEPPPMPVPFGPAPEAEEPEEEPQDPDLTEE